MKRYNTPHRHRVIKTRLTEEEYAEFSERVTLCKMSQAEFIRQALIKSSIRPVITAQNKLTIIIPAQIAFSIKRPTPLPHTCFSSQACLENRSKL